MFKPATKIKIPPTIETSAMSAGEIAEAKKRAQRYRLPCQISNTTPHKAITQPYAEAKMIEVIPSNNPFVKRYV